MPKQKTHKGLAKRVRVTKTGKIVRSKAGRRHLLSSKSRARKRKLRAKAVINHADLGQVLRTLRH